MNIPQPSTKKKYFALEIMVLVNIDQNGDSLENDISRAINEAEHPAFSLIHIESTLDYPFYEGDQE